MIIFTFKIWDQSDHWLKSYGQNTEHDCTFIELHHNTFQWIPEINEAKKGEAVPLVLVGTKLDLRAEAEPGSAVTYEEGGELANKIRANCYRECSAKTGENVSEVFEAAMEAYLRPRQHSIYNTNCFTGGVRKITQGCAIL